MQLSNYLWSQKQLRAVIGLLALTIPASLAEPVDAKTVKSEARAGCDATELLLKANIPCDGIVEVVTLITSEIQYSTELIGADALQPTSAQLKTVGYMCASGLAGMVGNFTFQGMEVTHEQARFFVRGCATQVILFLKSPDTYRALEAEYHSER